MDKRQLSILGLSYSQTQSGAYALVLAEENGNRRIPIIIGGAEAQSIAIELEGLNPIRPLTHDLFVSFAKAYNVKVIEVLIFKLEEGIFYSELLCDNGAGIVRIDARTSDAIALALRFKCPIYTSEDILKKAGIVFDFDDKGKSDDMNMTDRDKTTDIAELTLDELNEILQDVIKEENYEQASVIRDEINRRK